MQFDSLTFIVFFLLAVTAIIVLMLAIPTFTLTDEQSGQPLTPTTRTSLTIKVLRPVLIATICLVHMPYIAGYSAAIVDPASFPTLLGPFIKDTFARSAVPLLTVISGFLAYSSFRRYSFRRYLGQKLSRLLVPFITWNLLLAAAVALGYTLWQYPASGEHLLNYRGWDWVVYVFGLKSFPINGPLYFLRDLFLISLLAPVFRLMLVRQSLVLISLTGLMVLCIYQPQIKTLGYAWLFRCDMLFFFFLGFWAKHTRLDDKIVPLDKASNLWVITGLVALCILVTWLLTTFKPEIMLYARLKPFLGVAFLGALPIILGTVERCQHTRLIAWLKAASPYSFTLFLIHQPVAILFSYLLDTLGLAPNNTSPILLQLVVMLAFLTLSAITALVLARVYWKIRDRLCILPRQNKAT